jgi:hypothetical protein
MLLIYFWILCFHLKLIFSSPEGVNDKNWKIASLDLEAHEIYMKTKEEILPLIKTKYEFYYRPFKTSFKMRERIDCEINVKLDFLFANLLVSDLIKSMIFDDSKLFLFIFLFGLYGRSNRNNILLAKDLDSLSSYYVFRAFLFFDQFLFDIFTKKRFLNPKILMDPLETRNLVTILEILWSNKLERMTHKMLDNINYLKIKTKVEERLNFLFSFVDQGSECLLVREYESFLRDLQAGIPIGESLALRNFKFLVKNFVQTLQVIELDQYARKIEWLAFRTPKFLLHFFFVYKLRTLHYYFQIEILKDDLFASMQGYIDSSVVKVEGKLFIFGKAICMLNPDAKSEFFDQESKILELADLIKSKTSDVKKLY